MRSLVAYVPARGGSKRIPRKSIRLLGGKPALAHVVATLRQLDGLAATFVSTDDERIAEVARAAGATVLELRDAKLADDHTLFNVLLRHDLPRHLAFLGTSPTDVDVLVVLPTACLVPATLLEEAVEAFRKSSSPVLHSTVPFPISPFRALVTDGAGGWRALFPDMLNVRSQDLPMAQVDAGLFYLLRWDEVAQWKDHWFTVPPGPCCFPVNAEIAIDVDDPEDWCELEQRFERYGRHPIVG